MSADPQPESAPGLRLLKSPKLREVRFEDYPQIAALASKFHLLIESYEGWKHLWADNPAYREIKGKCPMGWVLDVGEGVIGGYLGNIPLNYELEGKRLLAATTRAWVVDTPYRTYSPLLLGTYFQQQNIDLFLSTTVNAQSALAYNIFQSVRVPVGEWDRTLFSITNYRGFTESLLRRRGGTLAKPLSYPLSVGAFLFDKFKTAHPATGTAIRVVPCSSFDNRFEAFWAALRKLKFNLLLGVRSQEALAWHFRFALLQNTAWIYVIEGKSGLAAYSVFLRHDYEEIGLTRIRLVDFQCLERDQAPELLLAMHGAAMERCRRESIHMLEVVGLTPELEKSLANVSPHQRALAAWLYFYKTSNSSLAERLKDKAIWEPSLFDGDSSL